MPVQLRPKLRPYLTAHRLDPARANGKQFLVHDLLRLSNTQLTLSASQLQCLLLWDGSRTVADFQTDARQFLGGQTYPTDEIQELIELLDQSLFLDTPRFRQKVEAPVRPMSCVGVYSDDPDVFREQMLDLFTQPGAAGLPCETGATNNLRAILAPHMDYHRGGVCYSYAFKELVESTTASLFVIIATSHYCPNRFTLTRKDFQTPLGIVRTDQIFIDRLIAHFGSDDLFEHEWLAHLPEHSIELEVVLLHYLYEKQRDIRIVPLAVGPFADCEVAGSDPSAVPEINRMISALQAVEQELNEPICYLISGDLAHIGPKHSDPHLVTSPQLRHSRDQDQQLLSYLEKADATAYFRLIAQEKNERRICGLPPTWLTLQTARPKYGRILHYEQFVDPTGYESVSFASVAFDR